MRFLLTGRDQGATKKVGGFVFEDGACVVSDHNQEGINAAINILSRFHEAYPEHVLEMVDGKLVKRVPEEVQEPREPADDVRAEEPVDPEVVDEAGGVLETPTAAAPEAKPKKGKK